MVAQQEEDLPRAAVHAPSLKDAQVEKYSNQTQREMIMLAYTIF